MPNIIFASNNIAHWPSISESTDSARFDNTRVPYSIAFEYEETATSPIFTPVAGAVSWVHFRSYMTARTTVDSDILIKAFDISGNPLFLLTKVSNTSAFVCRLRLYTGGADVDVNQSFPFNRHKINTIDVKYTNTDGALEAIMYVNGGQVAITNSGGTPGFGQIAYFSMGAAFCSTGLQMNVSEILIADGDTRNARLNLLRPTAEGGETDWVGLVLDLADDDPTTGMTTTMVDQRQTVQVGAYTGANNVSAVVVASQSYAGVGGPMNMRHTVRMGAVNYDSDADIPLTEALQYELTDYLINPGTSLPWTAADLAVMEMGFISKT